MKKFLSLVLALIMTMSLVTISAGAKDYTDASEINYDEAVGVMSALKVIDGYTDGSFNPDGTLTRGAAAKIICNLILGPTTAAALKADSAVFSDVPADHTFAGYIAYCAQQGIISGYADGTFKPSNGLTGYAFMKMLLCALGYDQYTEGYVGPNYSIQVAKQALAIGLDDGNDNFDGTKIVTREEALLYAFNTMTATMVSYNQKTEVKTGDAVVTIAGSRMDVANDIDDDYRYAGDEEAADKYMQFCEKYFGKLELKGDKTDAFDRPANTWYNGKTKIGTFTKDADFTYRVDKKVKELYKEIDDQEYYLFVDGADQGKVVDVRKTNKNDAEKLAAKVTTEGALIGNGSLIEVFEDEAVITVINTYLVKAAADYDEDAETLLLTGADIDQKLPADLTTELKLDDYASIVDYKEGDYIAITAAEGVVKSLTKVEPVTATVTEYVDTETVTAGGEEYKYNVTNNATEKEYGVKKDFEFYLDDQGNILFAKGVEASAKYIYIAEFYTHTNNTSRTPLYAYAYMTDGTEAEITVSKINDKKVNALSEAPEAGWFTYAEKAGKYELTSIVTDGEKDDIADLGTGKIVDYTGKDALGTKLGDEVNVRANSATIFVVVDAKDNVKVYTGIKNTPDITISGEGAIASAVVNGRYAKVVFIDIDGGKISGGSNSTDLVYVLKKELTSGATENGVDADDVKYYRYTAIVNGKETKVKSATDLTLANDTLFAGIEYNSKGYIVYADEVTAEYDAEVYEVIAADDYTITAKGQVINFIGTDVEQSFYLSEDGYTIYLIDITAEDVVKTYTTTYTLATKYKTTALENAALTAVLNAEGDVTALYINI